MVRPTSSYCYGFRVRATNWPVSRPIVGMRLREQIGGVDGDGNYLYEESHNWATPESQILGPNRWEWSDDFNAFVIPGTGGAVDETFLFQFTWSTGQEPSWLSTNPTMRIETSPGEDTIFQLDGCRGASLALAEFVEQFDSSLVAWTTNVTKESGRKWALKDIVSTASFDDSYEVLQEIVPGQTINLAVFMPAIAES